MSKNLYLLRLNVNIYVYLQRGTQVTLENQLYGKNRKLTKLYVKLYENKPMTNQTNSTRAVSKSMMLVVRGPIAGSVQNAMKSFEVFEVTFWRDSVHILADNTT